MDKVERDNATERKMRREEGRTKGFGDRKTSSRKKDSVGNGRLGWRETGTNAQNRNEGF